MFYLSKLMIIRINDIFYFRSDEYKCNFCTDVYKTKTNLTEHMILRHSSQCCTYCCEYFLKKNDLVHHIRFAHSIKRELKVNEFSLIMNFIINLLFFYFRINQKFVIFVESVLRTYTFTQCTVTQYI